MGHYLLMGVIKKDKIEDAIKAMKQVLKGYDEEMQDLKDKEHDKRVDALLKNPMLLLSKLYGEKPSLTVLKASFKMLNT